MNVTSSIQNQTETEPSPTLTTCRQVAGENPQVSSVCVCPTAEIGDYDELADRDFLRMNKLLPYQDKVQEAIVELHRRHL